MEQQQHNVHAAYFALLRLRDAFALSFPAAMLETEAVLMLSVHRIGNKPG